MSVSLTLYGMKPEEVMSDIYFQSSFVRLYAAPDKVDTLELPGFRHASAVRQIPGEELEDLETPWGYGGPVARDGDAFWRGIGEWRRRQADRGRVAEFIRMHPFLNPLAFRGWFDQIRFDRLTVLVDLSEPQDARHRNYSKGTRYSLRQAEKALTLRRLEAGEGELFRALYEAGLARNEADEEYFFPPDHFASLLGADWADVRVAELDGEAVAVACFLHGGRFAHYHLSGGTPLARELFAHHLLLEDAINRYAAAGLRWMHLGGGRGGGLGDSLLLFKTRFSPRRIAFYTGGIIFDRAAYDRLTRDRKGKFLSYRFQPTPEVKDEDVMLRPAAADDFAFFFRLKCDVDNIVWSGHDEPPAWLRLQEWYEWNLREESRSIFIGICGARRVGYVYLDDHGATLEMTLGVATSEAGRGVGRRLLALAIERLIAAGERRQTEAWIFEDNRASIRAFEAAGFERDDSRPPRNFNMPFLGDNRAQYCWVWRAAESQGPGR
jgi:RimJ/RimL family protein N-acetyltransferase